MGENFKPATKTNCDCVTHYCVQINIPKPHKKKTRLYIIFYERHSNFLSYYLTHRNLVTKLKTIK